MFFDNLNSDNIMIYAMKAYDRPDCILSEFKEDLKRFNYLKRLFYRYRKTGEVKERLVINHIIVLYNVFGVEVCTRMFFYKMSEEDYSIIKTYLLFLNYLPPFVRGINGKDINTNDIPVDLTIAEALRTIK
jgi:hypothetical protein